MTKGLEVAGERSTLLVRRELLEAEAGHGLPIFRSP